MKALRKPLSLFMAMLMCLGIFAGTGTTAFAAGETMTTYMVEFPRASDPNKAGWGHSAMNFLGGWSTGENNGFTIHTQDSFNGKVIYCIEPGVSVHSGDQFTGRGEDFWDDYPSDLNPTIPPDTIKEYIGRIMTYGWQGNASTSWMTDDPEDASKMAGAIATQLLVWETVVGERDSQFNHVDANAQGKNNIAEYISPENPLYSEIFSQYSAIESAVKRHTMLPSFFSSTADAGAYELKWDGQQYSLTLTDTNGVLSDYTFSSSTTGLNFSVDGNQLTITSARAIKGSVTVKAEKISAQRSGVVVWTDGIIGGGKQDFATYGETVSDYMVGYLNLEVKTGNMKLVKTSEDGQVAGISFTITGEGYSATKTTNEAGEIDITDLNPGVYTITEQSIDKYEPQETQRVTIVSGQTSTVNFNNKLKRGSLEVTKTSEDGLVEGMTFHLYGTSLSGQPVDEYAVTDGNGVARFENVLIGTGYVLEEVDTPIRYVVPDSQTATIEWNEVTHKSVNNMLKKFRVTVTKSDVETGAPQGDGSLAGAVYDPDGKVAVCARNVYRIWEQTKEKRSTQLVFCDLSTPTTDGSFSVYDDLKKKLLDAGIPEDEIAFIHTADSEAKKKELFAKVRAGQVRILMGSTQKMGAGTNVQDRLIALHDLDCPWRPSDLQQRLGRIVRQGNENEEVEIYRYVTEGTFDAYLYQLVENKQKFIAQIMTSKAPVRVADDVDETALSYSEIKALATGNPLIIEKCNLDMEVARLNMLKASHLNQVYALEELVYRKYPEEITQLTERIAGYEQDVALAAAHPKAQEGFCGMEVDGRHYTEKEGAGKAIIDVCTRMTGSDAVLLGQYRGFSMVLAYDGRSNEYRITLKGTLSHTVTLGADVFGNITRLDNALENLAGNLDAERAKLEEARVQLENARTELATPFAREDELAEKTARLKELNILLNMDEKDKTLIDEAPDEGEEPPMRKVVGLER